MQSTQRFSRKARLTQRKMEENELSFKIIGVAIDIHKQLGPGLL